MFQILLLNTAGVSKILILEGRCIFISETAPVKYKMHRPLPHGGRFQYCVNKSFSINIHHTLYQIFEFGTAWSFPRLLRLKYYSLNCDRCINQLLLAFPTTCELPVYQKLCFKGAGAF